ncbi:extensin family protein [Roseivivax halodurans JCM 10272]|uniref:Extensin family protein n=1 Tax=Roseivivax halodurans JCM 10272 TaxID=1449350 RepID=X7EIS0_9RHOB|nr:extensin family protein [Roseivivax halodurans]ETX15780.1 extensin family protein [Roseivivax halodurans JCM 10272]
MRALGLVALLALAAPALADAPETSLRPVSRALAAEADPDLRPAARPITEAKLARKLIARWERLEPVPRATPLRYFPGYEDTDIRAFAQASPQAVSHALRPLRRTESLAQKAMARQAERRRGALCGDVGIQGEAVGYVPGRLDACEIRDAVEVRSVSGVALSHHALMDCTTARALKSWVDRGLKPAVGSAGGGVDRLRVAAHYSCRTRNNQPGAEVSEHGKGRAIDISAIRLRDGTRMTVLGGYRSEAHGPILQRAYRAACGIFATTLGPDSDRFHQDHFHFDTARRRSGAYCP